MKVLDCTFRDGGYYNQWNFSLSLVNKYLLAMGNARVDAIEIGFRFKPKNSFLGAFAYSTDSLLETLNLPEIPIGVMVNGSDVANYSVDNMFCPCHDSIIDRVRIALHFGKIEESETTARRLKELGYEVGVNLMQAGGKDDDVIQNACRAIREWGVDFLYFADSLGDMDVENVRHTMEVIKDEWNGHLGFHGHDNKGQALNNSFAAIDAGAEWVDSTVLGMGRGAGNARTEYLLAEFAHKGMDYNPNALFPIVLDDFAELQKKFGWGPNLLYYLSAMKHIHPTYVQEMVSSLQYSPPVMLKGIEKLGDSKSSSFNKDALKTALTSDVKYIGSWKATGFTKDKNILIIASGEKGEQHFDALVKYIKNLSPLVICLNSNTGFPNEHVDLYAACDRTRLLVEVEKYRKLRKSVLMPKFWLDQKNYQGIDVLDYGVEICSHKLESYESHCVIPNILVAAYVFAAVHQGGAKRILLAGFDGYGDSHIELQERMSEVFELYNGPDIIAITPTSYNIKQRSVYEPEFTGK